jgi:hypothetical protein
MSIQPPGIPNISFDYFNIAETPNFILCNPNKDELYSLGGISERKLSAKFNTLSEISFRADEYVDNIYMEYYPYLVQRRLVYVETIGYFIISDVSEKNDGIQKYKEITCQSLEAELISKRMVIYISGSSLLGIPESITLEELLEDITENFISDWSYSSIPDSLSEIQLGFDVSDKTIYDFLMNDVEEAYGCVFYFDTINKTIYIADPEEVLVETDIFISHDNVIKNIGTKEVTDELATSLNVLGGGGLDINDINPMGGNNIYKFDYFKNTNWMSQGVIDKIDEWENTYDLYAPGYATTAEYVYVILDRISLLRTDLTVYSASIVALEIEQAEYIKAGDEENSALIQERIDETHENINYTNALMALENGNLSISLGILSEIRDLVSFETIFTNTELLELQPFIIQSSYVNDNIIITDNMSPCQVFQQMSVLKSKGETVLERMSSPKYLIEIDSVNFMYIQEFYNFRNQLYLGAQITLEIKENEYIYPFLLEMTIDFDSPENFSMVFGNRMRLDNEGFIFTDIINRAISSGNKSKIYSQQWGNWGNYKDNIINFVSSTISASSNQIVSGSHLQIIVNPAGLKARTRLDDGTYDPRQLWIINNSIYTTQDGWDTFNILLGSGGGVQAEQSIYGAQPEEVIGYGISGSSIIGNISGVVNPQNILSGSAYGVNITGSKAEFNVAEGNLLLTGSLIKSASSSGSFVDSGGFIYIPFDEPWLADSGTGHSNWSGSAKSDILSALDLDISEIFNGSNPGVPSDTGFIKAYYIQLLAIDTGAPASLYFTVGNTDSESQLYCVPNVKDEWASAHGMVKPDSQGDIVVLIDASGAQAMTVWIKILGCFV